MIKRKPTHPKLYLNIELQNKKLFLIYKKNTFNEFGDRIIEQEILEDSDIISDKCFFLTKKNNEQFKILKNYIKIQKKVLDKYQKMRNYDSFKIVQYSIQSMISFENEFLIWFQNK